MAYEKKFIHFGCWNQGVCKKKDPENNTPITRVMRQLETTITRVANGNNKYDFIVVAGDNYYPDKPEKKDKGWALPYYELCLFAGKRNIWFLKYL
jgi:hypothetical protein